ncbi:uncharacterized protein LOC131932358 [Physella acuta]|uniref:uncharacterized protein LOC131932358 n=1 Tax=Physella acuta TaxID=109671 RepID=UPI0027DB8405|nr:uncharacterized protein LOC131932358 [Physella acuta]
MQAYYNVSVVTFDPLITNEQFKILRRVFYSGLWPLVSVFCFTCNTVNITVFLKVGIQDSVTLSFLALAVVDACYVVCSAVSVAYLNRAINAEDVFKIASLFSLGGYSSAYMDLFFNMSIAIGTYISVVKCCCVVKPLTFKLMFTTRRTLVVLIIIVLACFTTKFPRYSKFGVTWQRSPYNNQSDFKLWFASDYPTYERVNFLLNETIYPVLVSSTVIVCSVVLTKALIKASRVRRTMTHVFKTDITKIITDSQDNETSNTVMLSNKELKVLKTVAILTGFLLLEVVLVSANALAMVFIEEFAPGRRYSNLNATTQYVRIFWIQVTASVNTVLYIQYNSRFRKCFKLIFVSRFMGVSCRPEGHV